MASARKGETPSTRTKTKAASKKQTRAAKKAAAAAPQKQTRAERKAENSERWLGGQQEELRKIRDAIPKVVSKPVKTRGVLDPSIVTAPKDGTVGRPAIVYTDEMDARFFEYVAGGLSLEKISRVEGFPSTVTLLKWINSKDHKCSLTYARAKELLVTLYEERALEAAIDPLEGEVSSRRTGEHSYNETRKFDAIERSKLRFQAYQWALGYMSPKKHGRQATPQDTADTALDELLGEFKQRNGVVNG